MRAIARKIKIQRRALSVPTPRALSTFTRTLRPFTPRIQAHLFVLAKGLVLALLHLFAVAQTLVFNRRYDSAQVRHYALSCSVAVFQVNALGAIGPFSPSRPLGYEFVFIDLGYLNVLSLFCFKHF